MKNKKLPDTERVFIHTVMFKEGIVPMEDPTMDVRRALQNMPVDEARALKRKFRKLWRKKMKESQAAAVPRHHRTNVGQTPEKIYGEKGQVPTRLQKLNRKRAVVADIMKTKVEPLIEKFNRLEKQTFVVHSPKQENINDIDNQEP